MGELFPHTPELLREVTLLPLRVMNGSSPPRLVEGGGVIPHTPELLREVTLLPLRVMNGNSPPRLVGGGYTPTPGLLREVTLLPLRVMNGKSHLPLKAYLSLGCFRLMLRQLRADVGSQPRCIFIPNAAVCKAALILPGLHSSTGVYTVPLRSRR